MASIKEWFEATFNGIAQIAFSNNLKSGYLVFFSILSISPFSALGALAGVTINNIISYRFYKEDFLLEWKKGFFGYSSGILGIIIGSYLIHSSIYFFVFFVSIIFCSLLDIYLRKFLITYSIPPFAISPIIIFWAIDFSLSSFNYPSWVSIGIFPLGNWSVYICTIGIVIVLFINNIKATFLTIFLSSIAIIISSQIFKLPLDQSSGLWAFNIATLCYISSVFYLPLGIRGFIFVILSTLLSFLIWTLWVYSGLWEILPPLIAPFTISILILVFILNKFFGPIIYTPNLWKFVKQIKKGKNICVLTGAGVSTPSGIPDYVSGAWLDKKHNYQDYSFTNFLKHRSSRKIYWEVCYKFYRNYQNKKYNLIHKVLYYLEKKKKITSIITQNVDGFHQEAGSKNVIELHGNISKLSCIHCKKKYQWNKMEKKWLKKDIKCSECLDFVKPSVIAMEQELEPLVWTKAKNKIKDAKLLLILGTQLSISSAIGLIDIARKNKTKIMIINNTEVAIKLKENEDILYYPLEKFFKIFSIKS